MYWDINIFLIYIGCQGVLIIKNNVNDSAMHVLICFTGLPSLHFSYVKNIEPGLPLFLFNYTGRKMHGIYEAASHGQMNIDLYAWTDNGTERTPFPAQVSSMMCCFFLFVFSKNILHLEVQIEVLIISVWV